MLNQNEKKYDLEERVSLFGEDVINFLKPIARDQFNLPIISQLIRSATSVGANYMEANCAEPKKDFRHKLSICKKEAKETTYWLRMMIQITPEKENACQKLKQEAHELVLIFSSILQKRGSN